MTRFDNILDLMIIKNEEIQHQWIQGVSRPLSYLYLVFCVDPNYCNYTEATFTSLMTLLFDNSTTTTTIIGFSDYVLSFIVILNLGVILYSRKTRK